MKAKMLNTPVDAEYQCVNCGLRWLSIRGAMQCHKCKSLYVKWVNFEELFNAKTTAKDEPHNDIVTGNLSDLLGHIDGGHLF
jgi:hypothetical protein